MTGISPIAPQWYSYCFNAATADVTDEIYQKLLSYLLTSNITSYKAFAECKGDHFHLLVMGPFLSKRGNVSTPSHTYIWQKLKAMAENLPQMEDEPSSMRVRDLMAYLKYLGVRPRKLVDWSNNLHDLVEIKQFFQKEMKWKMMIILTCSCLKEISTICNWNN